MGKLPFQNVREDAEKYPFYHIAIVSLLSIGLVSISLKFLFQLFIASEKIATLYSGLTIRLIIFIGLFFFFFRYGFNKDFLKRFNKKGVLCFVLALIVAINNFPIIAVIRGDVVINEGTLTTALFLTYCLAVSLFEELAFRGIVFPLCEIAFKEKRTSFWSIALSSGIFGGIHIFNLFAGSGVGAVILQVGYSFLIGALCCITLVYTKNIFCPVVIHFVFDIGGLLTDRNIGIAKGFQWNTETVILTAVIGCIVAGYMIYLAIKSDKSLQ